MVKRVWVLPCSRRKTRHKMIPGLNGTGFHGVGTKSYPFQRFHDVWHYNQEFAQPNAQSPRRRYINWGLCEIHWNHRKLAADFVLKLWLLRTSINHIRCPDGGCDVWFGGGGLVDALLMDVDIKGFDLELWMQQASKVMAFLIMFFGFFSV